MPENTRTEIPFNDGGIVEIYHVDRQETETVTEVGWGRNRGNIFGKGALGVYVYRRHRQVAVSHLRWL
jgi:hypothetical protein